MAPVPETEERRKKQGEKRYKQLYNKHYKIHSSIIMDIKCTSTSLCISIPGAKGHP